jgi:glycerol-3-phosphate acyltransferase PlsY
VLELLAVLFCSYLIGSIPVGFLVVWKKANVDIRDAGSGRAGGFNAYVVTRSRLTGIVVGILDALKGFLPVLAVTLIFPASFLHGGLSLFGAIIGHNFPVWTGFKGGRGLATAAGGMVLLGFSFTVLWCLIWFFTKVALKRDILVSNLAAIMATPLMLWILPWPWVNKLVVMKVDEGAFAFFCCVLAMVLLLSHLDVLSDVWKGNPTEQPEMTSTQSKTSEKP